MMSRRQSGASGIFIASSLIADSPEKDKENTEPGNTPVARLAGESGSRSGRKSILSRRRSSGIGRRLSGFGGGGFDVNNADKSKMDSMYSSIIKMSTENKITRDKCWGLHFIEYMDKMILGDDQGTGSATKVNFQKASCTIDASVKIYSHRVDATHESSYSLLQNLSRRDDGKTHGRADTGDSRAGGSEKSAKVGVQETLKTAEQLNLTNLDREFAVDPMFHKMSKIFDEAGSKGMLLNNLCVSDGCKVSFDSNVTSDVTAPPSEDEGSEHKERGNDHQSSSDQAGQEKRKRDDQDDAGADDTEKHDETTDRSPAKEAVEMSGGMVDVSILREKLFGLCDDLSTLVLCPQLEGFREQIAELEDADKGTTRTTNARFNGHVDNNCDSDSDGPGGGFDDVPGGDDASFVGGGDAAMDDSDAFQADTGEAWGPVGDSTALEGGVEQGRSSFGIGGDNGDVRGGGFRDDRRSSGPGTSWGVPPIASSGPASLQDRLYGDLKVVNDDYAFYEVGALAAAAASNHWAGASHWKFVRRKKKAAAGSKVGVDGADGEGEGEEGGRRAKGKRRAPAIDFDAPMVPESAFAPPKKPVRSRAGGKKSDPTLLSEEYVNRALKAAEDGSTTYTLPENAGFKTKDLGELFLRPGAFAKRWVAVEAGGVAGGGGFGHGDLQGFNDSGNGRQGAGDDGDLVFDAGDGGFGGGDDFDDDDDDDIGSTGFVVVEEFGGVSGGRGGVGIEIGEDGMIVDDFHAEGLLSAERKVEKISITYARKAKRVDVRRLKGDLWRKIDSAVVQKERVSVGGGEAVTGEDDVNSEVENRKNEGDQEEEKEGAEAENSKPKDAGMTFSDIVQDVASQEEQVGVTVPFYFICVLHLANEKGLRLEGHEDLLDFSVSSDPVTGRSY